MNGDERGRSFGEGDEDCLSVALAKDFNGDSLAHDRKTCDEVRPVKGAVFGVVKVTSAVELMAADA